MANVARFEIKPGRSGGYERWRSYEFRPHTPARGKEDVYVYHHRLLTILDFPEDMPLRDIFQEMRGSDVHHINGVKWDNRPENLELMEHGAHASLTNSGPSRSEQRAHAETAKRQMESARSPEQSAGDVCPRCNELVDMVVESPATDEPLCLTCSTAVQRARKAGTVEASE